MAAIVVTGAGGLIGAECVRRFGRKGYHVIGIDNDTRRVLFGTAASVHKTIQALRTASANYEHHDLDIRDCAGVAELFRRNQGQIAAVIHCAAQPSHDWAAQEPLVDFDINARATVGLLNATKAYASAATFVYLSTNKVYGDAPNSLKYCDIGTRLEPFGDSHSRHDGFTEDTPIDTRLHSLFGCSKLAADIYVQEYGLYYGMNTVCFRGGCLTGPGHAGAKQHGFLSYLLRCCVAEMPYEIIGYGGKQVRDNIHASDLVSAIEMFLEHPKPGAVYNIGGGRGNSCSILEAIALAEEVTGKKMRIAYREQPRIGDHIWWITNTEKFRTDFPDWKIRKSLRDIIAEIAEASLTDGD